jgi:hypothetical protein
LPIKDKREEEEKKKEVQMANDQVITIMGRTITFISLSLFNKKESNFIHHTLFHYDNVAGFSNH